MGAGRAGGVVIASPGFFRGVATASGEVGKTEKEWGKACGVASTVKWFSWQLCASDESALRIEKRPAGHISLAGDLN